jgi:hypothetical protein
MRPILPNLRIKPLGLKEDLAITSGDLRWRLHFQTFGPDFGNGARPRRLTCGKNPQPDRAGTDTPVMLVDRTTPGWARFLAVAFSLMIFLCCAVVAIASVFFESLVGDGRQPIGCTAHCRRPRT